MCSGRDPKGWSVVSDQAGGFTESAAPWTMVAKLRTLVSSHQTSFDSDCRTAADQDVDPLGQLCTKNVVILPSLPL